MPLMFLNGTGMSGQSTHWIVGDSPMVAATSTAPRYAFHAVGGAYPGLEDVGPGGASIVGEVYDVSYAQLREVLLPAEPPGLELGVIELADGTGSLAMVVRRSYAETEVTEDISALGSWRDYQQQQRQRQQQEEEARR
jgi:gamma-glutamylcyclotransferase (GGCT)/AIG2-like uncharacterized protein YtfP